MVKRIIRDTKAGYSAWSLDQLAKSEFFHEKLHEWRLLEVAGQIEAIQGETLDWVLSDLGISERAWNKVIHRGIKPVTLFAHPYILQSILRAVSYYRMMAMVSQKSMNNVGLAVNRYESGAVNPDSQRAFALSRHLNRIICSLVETDEVIDAREFDLWRGMAAGTQAQGSWQNLKGRRVEVQVKSLLRQRVREKGLVVVETADRIELQNGSILFFADEPDIALYQDNVVQVAVEIKGGIDTAAILERIGAAIKSLSRAKEENVQACTILLIQEVSLTQTATADLEINRSAVNYWFTVESFLNDPGQREQVFHLMGL